MVPVVPSMNESGFEKSPACAPRAQPGTCHDTNQFSPNLPVSTGTGQERIRPRSIIREMFMTIKNVVVPLEIEYLQEAAKKRGISRTKLVQVVMEKVVKDELVLEILDDDEQVRTEPRKPRYRRFRERNAG
jgi:hypothetical protein